MITSENSYGSLVQVAIVIGALLSLLNFKFFLVQFDIIYVANLKF